MYPLWARPARCAATTFYLRSGFFVFRVNRRKVRRPARELLPHHAFQCREACSCSRWRTSRTTWPPSHRREPPRRYFSRMQANVREASMPELSATEQPEQSNIVTWKVISIGTAIVVVVFLFLWL